MIGGVLFHYVQYLGFLLPSALAVYVGNLGITHVPTPAPVAVPASVPDP
jgi:hypothetical protein